MVELLWNEGMIGAFAIHSLIPSFLQSFLLTPLELILQLGQLFPFALVG